jgi:hypothetical protein
VETNPNRIRQTRLSSRILGLIKPFNEQLAEKQRHDAQVRLFQRHQAFGMLLVAAVILVWWLFHTNPAWIFPAGWWRP